MQAQSGGSGTALTIFNLGARSCWGINVTPQPLYLKKIALLPIVEEAKRALGTV